MIFAAGTLNADEPRDLDLPLKDRFFLQPQTPELAVARAKESAKDIINVKGSIEKKAWPFVRDDLRLKAGYLRYDLKTIISAKPKEEKQILKDLSGKLFQDINNVSVCLCYFIIALNFRCCNESDIFLFPPSTGDLAVGLCSKDEEQLRSREVLCSNCVNPQ